MTEAMPDKLKRLLRMPRRPEDAHKGSLGKAIVIGGSRGMTGAIALTAEAALRIGAGVVTLACPETVQDVLATKLTSVMTFGVADDGEGRMASDGAEALIDFAADFGYAAIGPGVGRSDGVQQLFGKVVRAFEGPAVIDADGLFALAHDLEALAARPERATVLTPHVGEMARLADLDIEDVLNDRRATAIAFAKRHRAIVVLKGPGTIVTDGDSAFENTSGGPELATAGSGDVLTGLIVGLMAQGAPPLQAAVLGVHLHGLCGQYGADDWTTYGLISSDLVRYLPQAIRTVEGNGV